MDSTLTKIDFFDTKKWTPASSLDGPLGVLFEHGPHSFAIGELRKIRDWAPRGIVATSGQLHVITNISVSSKHGVTTYVVTAREIITTQEAPGSHMLILTGRVVPGDPFPPQSTYWLRQTQDSSERDPRIARALEVLEGGAQRQDSLSDQMKDAEALMVAAGMYDVLTWIHDRRRH